MRLLKLSIRNFKGVKNISLETHNRNVVLFGVNGTGKSSLLAAVNYCFWIWINRLNASQGTAYKSFSTDLFHNGCSELSLETTVSLNDSIFPLSRTCKKTATNIKAEQSKDIYDDFLKFYTNQYVESESSNMPIFVNYGTNRSVLETPLRIRRKHQFAKLTSIERAIENKLDFRTFFEWYRNQEDIENEQIREIGDRSYQDIQLKCVRKAIETMLDNVHDLRIKRNPLRMVVQKGAFTITVDQLSDGEKCTLALLGDLARRTALANPNLANPLNGDGIVLIDEIELHMHPLWQRRILGVLKTVFPNIQFIVTTHSPQVLGEVNDDYAIYRLSQNENMVTELTSIPRMDGYDSNMILESFMDTRSINAAFAKLLDDTSDAIQNENFDDAETLLSQLQNIYDANQAEIIRLEGLLKRAKLLYAKNH